MTDAQFVVVYLSGLLTGLFTFGVTIYVRDNNRSFSGMCPLCGRISSKLKRLIALD